VHKTLPGARILPVLGALAAQQEPLAHHAAHGYPAHEGRGAGGGVRVGGRRGRAGGGVLRVLWLGGLGYRP